MDWGELGSPALSKGFHNLFVIFVFTVLWIWISRVVLQFRRVLDLLENLRSRHVLPLSGTSIYAEDFQELIPQHFFHILRIRGFIRGQPVKRLALFSHLQPESLSAFRTQTANEDLFGINFSIDVSAPCSVRLFWGVSVAACNRLYRRLSEKAKDAKRSSDRNNLRLSFRGLRWPSFFGNSTTSPLSQPLLGGANVLENEGDADRPVLGFSQDEFMAQSGERYVAGDSRGYKYSSQGADLVDMQMIRRIRRKQPPSFEDNTVFTADDVVPLVIIVESRRSRDREAQQNSHVDVLEATGEMSFVWLKRNDSSGDFVPEMFRPQFVFSDRAACDVNGILFTDDPECIVCLSQQKRILLFPCRHCVLCYRCVKGLREERCPLCRAPFHAFLLFPKARDDRSMN